MIPTPIAPTLSPVSFTFRIIPRHSAFPTAARLHSFTLEERVHAPYDLRAVVTLARAPELDTLHHAHVELGIRRGASIRVIYGLVLALDLVDGQGETRLVQLHVGPALALLGERPRCRIFQDLTAIQATQLVLEQPLLEFGSGLDTSRLVARYERLAHLVQCHETDLAFVQRVLAEAGITLLLHHGDGCETVALVDDDDALPPGGCEPLFRDQRTRVPWLPVVAARPPDEPVESIHLDALLADETRVELHATSNATILRAGSVFELEDPPSDDHDETWVVSWIRHTGLAPVADGDASYANELRCRPWRLPLAPTQPVHPRATETPTAVAEAKNARSTSTR